MSIDDPQVEFGYVKIATELLWAMDRARLSPQKRAILGCILINTYGRGKKEAHISIDYFMSYTGMTRKNVHKTIGYMKKENLINAFQIEGKKYLKYSINKKYLEWQTPSKQKLLPSKWKAYAFRLEVPLPSRINKYNNNTRARSAQIDKELNDQRINESEALFNLYTEVVASTHRTPKAAKENIAYHLKNNSYKSLEGAIRNYGAECDRNQTDFDYRKDARNFFGRKRPYFFQDFLPGVYQPPARPKSYAPIN